MGRKVICHTSTSIQLVIYTPIATLTVAVAAAALLHSEIWFLPTVLLLYLSVLFSQLCFYVQLGLALLLLLPQMPPKLAKATVLSPLKRPLTVVLQGSFKLSRKPKPMALTFPFLGSMSSKFHSYNHHYAYAYAYASASAFGLSENTLLHFAKHQCIVFLKVQKIRFKSWLRERCSYLVFDSILNYIISLCALLHFPKHQCFFHFPKPLLFFFICCQLVCFFQLEGFESTISSSVLCPLT